MNRIHIFNPVSGCGHSPALLDEGPAKNEERHITDSVGDAERFAYMTCIKRPDTHFIVYGGDGTINEVANGILRAGAGSESMISVVPAGTGNDFVRTFGEKNRIYTIDAIKYNERYAVNIINFGFDCDVVKKTDRYKKILPGSPAYLAGVADAIFHKMGNEWSFEIYDADGNAEHIDGSFTLALVGNCRYYGGGFCSASLADPGDGLLDFLAVRKISRAAFISLIGAYKKGKHLDPETFAPYAKFQKHMLYRRVTRINIKGVSSICADGEIEEAETVNVSVIRNALRIAT